MPIGLPQSERSAVFRALALILRQDPMLTATVRTFVDWSGGPNDNNPPTLAMCPYLRLTPTGSADEWASPATHVGALYINIEMMVAGYAVDDLADLWRAVIAAIYDPQGTTFAAVQAALRDAGAYPPSPQFTMPAFDPKPESNYCYGIAQIRIMVQTRLGSRGVVIP